MHGRQLPVAMRVTSERGRLARPFLRAQPMRARRPRSDVIGAGTCYSAISLFLASNLFGESRKDL